MGRRFSDRVFAIPFGRYQSGNEPGISNEVLVGRQEQRAYFIELLLRMGRRGAYLVTGRRGVGKTSFVNYCLEDYKEEVFERFLRSNVGRVLFWDHLGVMLLGFGLIFVLLMISEFMEILTFSTGWGKGDSPNILFGLVIIPLALICLYPLLYAREVIRRICLSGYSGARGYEVSATIVTIFLGVALFFLPPFGAPAVSMSRLLFSICALYLWVQAYSFNSESVRDSGEGRWWSAKNLASVCAVLLLFVWGPDLAGFLDKSWQADPESEFYGNIFGSLMLIGAGSLFRARYLYVQKDAGRSVGRRTAHKSYYGLSWLLLAAVIALPCAMYSFSGKFRVADFSLVATFVSIVSAVVVFSIRVAGRSGKAAQSDESFSFRPCPLAVLSIKAVLSIVVSLQLVHPIFDKWTPAQADPGTFDELVKEPPHRRSSAALWKISSLSEAEKNLRDEIAKLKDDLEQGEWRGTLANKAANFKESVPLGYIEEGFLKKEEAPSLAWKAFVEGEENKEKKDNIRLMLKEAELHHVKSNSAVFYGRVEEISWVVALFLCLVVLFFMEYEWILRPFIREREDPALDPIRVAPWQDQIRSDGMRLNRRDYQRLAHVTLPWLLYEKWLPVLTIRVNLGFERLDHRRVVHAMLAGLTDQYQRAFRAWNSGLANLGRLFGFLLLMMLVTLAGDRWFAMPDLSEGSVEPGASYVQGDYSEICRLFNGRQKGSGAANWICKLKWGDQLFHILYYNVLDVSELRLYRERDLHLLFYVFPYREEEWPMKEVWSVGGRAGRANGSTEEQKAPVPLLASGMHLRIYHIMLFALFLVIGRWLLHRLPIFPYAEILRRIDDTMDRLSARTSVTSTMGRWKPAQWLQGFFIDERVRQTEQDPVDPRTVEFVFLQILRDIQGAAIQLPGGRNQLISLPTPEITFVLDELDKIGMRVDPDEIGSSGGAQQAEILSAERRRSAELHKLLADMKNLLSSAPARFIFIGGRNLHDEWLADQTSRQPLLTNIFTAEIYLPSLLTDLESAKEKSLSAQVVIYLGNQLQRATDLYEASQSKIWSHVLALPLERRERESFVEDVENKPGEIAKLKVYPADSDDMHGNNNRDDKGFPGHKELVRDFIQFLTYRSMGNPKKLKELLGNFVRPAGRVVKENLRWEKEFGTCNHVLYFGDTERFRIQLLSRVYRHLAGHFEHSLVQRDDKLAASVLYLTDFLFKFHRRAFSWSNLERVDELVHIHRAPDLREILEALVAQWSERFLHPIRNGMYDFRFRSDMAREIEYVSRQSAEEMAAFNFTLDESQTLKAAYETNIARLKEGNGIEIQDLVAGLGELHEFDQEYETARLYYRRAISLLDKELEEMMGGSILAESTSRIEIIGATPGGQEQARLYMTWGVARLRLMLQIGMTFEHSRNLERAEMEYQNARTLADGLLLALLDDDGRLRASEMGIRYAGDKLALKGEERLHALKHLNILFQPIFAEAWSAEKLAGGVDTSTTLAEHELWKLRNLLPFVRDSDLRLSDTGADARGSNFALIATELHNKTGDLYFFKGRQLPVLREPLALKGAIQSKGFEGYLLSAHYHYAVGLHELRRFIAHRKKSSVSKLNHWIEPWETISSEGWPDFVLRAVGGALNDLAEALLARVSLLTLLSASEPEDHKWHQDIKNRIESIAASSTQWLEHDTVLSSGEKYLEIPSLVDRRSLGTWNNWLGVWEWDTEKKRVIKFESTDRHTDPDLFLFSLSASLVGAHYLKAGGYTEDAGRELLKVCETVNYYLWWGLMVKQLSGKAEPGEAASTWRGLFDLGLYALREAGELFGRSRRHMEGNESSGGSERSYLGGGIVPVFAVTLACSLGLAAKQWEYGEALQKSLTELLGDWTGKSSFEEDGKEFADSLRSILKDSLVRNSYPMLNRLYVLKILIDDATLRGNKGEGNDIVEWTLELLDLEASLNAPLHFTPLDLGTTCALVYLLGGERESKDMKRILHAAERALLSSQEMYSLRRSFYENISDLYYLYDDFNDRQLHFNHAIQMAGAELAVLLQGCIDRGPSGKPALVMSVAAEAAA